MTGGVPLGKGPVAFWLQPMDPEAVRAGKEAPAKIRWAGLPAVCAARSPGQWDGQQGWL